MWSRILILSTLLVTFRFPNTAAVGTRDNAMPYDSTEALVNVRRAEESRLQQASIHASQSPQHRPFLDDHPFYAARGMDESFVKRDLDKRTLKNGTLSWADLVAIGGLSSLGAFGAGAISYLAIDKIRHPERYRRNHRTTSHRETELGTIHNDLSRTSSSLTRHSESSELRQPLLRHVSRTSSAQNFQHLQPVQLTPSARVQLSQMPRRGSAHFRKRSLSKRDSGQSSSDNGDDSWLFGLGAGSGVALAGGTILAAFGHVYHEKHKAARAKKRLQTELDSFRQSRNGNRVNSWTHRP